MRLLTMIGAGLASNEVGWYPFVLSWSMLEALAAGCLVIASRTAPVEEVIREGENGLLVDFFNPDALAQQAIEALAKPEAYAALRTAARQSIVERYDLHRIALPAQLALIEEVTGAASEFPCRATGKG